jgi:hypothetical protein
MGKIKTKSDIPGTGNYYVSTIFLNPKQVEFLVRCIDIAQETQSLKPDKSQVEVIRELTRIQQDNEDKDFGSYKVN